MGPGGARRQSQKDYVLLRDDATPDDVFDPEEAAQRRKTGTVRGILRLLGLARKEVCILLLGSVMLMVGSLAAVAVPKLAGQLLDICINLDRDNKRQAELKVNDQLVQILIILAVGGFASGIRSWLFQGASERVMASLRADLFSHLMTQELGFFDRVRTGELMNRLSEDTRLMKSAGTVSISVALRSITVATLGLVLMFHTSVVLSGLTLAVLPVMLVAFQVYSRFNRRYTSQSLTSSAQASVVAEECFGSIRTVRSFGKEEAACQRYRDAAARTCSWGLKSAAAGGVFTTFTGTVAPGAIMAVLWWGARLVIDDRLSVGQLSSFVVYSIFVSGNVGQLAGVFTSLMQAVGASERVFELLDRETLMRRPKGGLRPQGQPAGGHVQLRNVWFAYPSRPGATVLQGISIDLPPGSRSALVGPSGGGKSTVVNLIERFYEPQRGQVLLDGTALDAIDHEFLHTQVALVSQEPVLFAESIRFNLTFGIPGGSANITQDQVVEAARIANAHDFISAFPQGYNTAVGERGVRLSGGQKQRIAIARALLCNPRVLLLDEATSALDAESEGLVQQALERASAGRTVLAIAHRLSTVQGSDQVFVVADGVIAEQGTHTQLLQKGGTYANLIRRQLMGSTLAERVASSHSTSCGEDDSSDGRQQRLLASGKETPHAVSSTDGKGSTLSITGFNTVDRSDSDVEEGSVTDRETLGTGSHGNSSESELDVRY